MSDENGSYNVPFLIPGTSSVGVEKEAFNNRKPGEEFSVKALFSDGKNGEWMWVSVDSIEDGDISGSLENSPVDVRDVSRGDQVRVRAAEIGDWVYSRNGIDHGGFRRILFR